MNNSSSASPGRNYGCEQGWLFLLFLLCSSSAAFAQDRFSLPQGWTFGIQAIADRSVQSIDFKELPGMAMPEDALPFRTADNATGFMIGIPLFYRFGDWALYQQLQYGSMPLHFSTIENTAFSDTGKALYERGVIGHNLDGSMQRLSIALGAGYRLYRQLWCFGSAGIDPVISADLQRTSRVLSPAGVELALPSQQTLPNVALRTRLSLQGGIAYTIALSPRFFLQPELSFSYNVNSIVSGVQWSLHRASAGISLLYSVEKSFTDSIPDSLPASPTTPPPADTNQTPPATLSSPLTSPSGAVPLSAQSAAQKQPNALLSSLGNLQENAILMAGIRAYNNGVSLGRPVQKLREQYSIEEIITIPRCISLPTVQKYWQNFQSPSLAALEHNYIWQNAEEVYTSLPTIVANRLLAARKGSSLLLKGHSAQAMKKLLEAFLPPHHAHIIAKEDSSEQSLRFVSTDSALFAPIWIRKDSTVLYANSGIVFRPEVLSEAEVQEWSIRIYSSDSVVSTLSGKVLPDSVEWNIPPAFLLDNRDSLVLSYTLSVRTSESTVTSPAGIIRITASSANGSALPPLTENRRKNLVCIRGSINDSTVVASYLSSLLQPGTEAYLSMQHFPNSTLYQFFARLFARHEGIRVYNNPHPLYRTVSVPDFCQEGFLLVIEGVSK